LKTKKTVVALLQCIKGSVCWIKWQWILCIILLSELKNFPSSLDFETFQVLNALISTNLRKSQNFLFFFRISKFAIFKCIIFVMWAIISPSCSDRPRLRQDSWITDIKWAVMYLCQGFSFPNELFGCKFKSILIWFCFISCVL
jgi:hypothetical protein